MQPLSIDFEHGTPVKGVYLSEATEIPAALNALGLKTAVPTLVVVGGASGLGAEDLEKLRSLFTEVLCPFANSLGFTVIDGGTDAGVMQLMGQARTAAGCSFPLVGVVVERKALLPKRLPPAEDAAALEPHHTHFLLVPGDEWGEESKWIAQTASTLADGQPSITLLINGGAIALHQDVPNSLAHKRPVLVISGSGRSADRLAQAITHPNSDPELQAMVDSGLLYTLGLNAGVFTLKTALESVLGSHS